MMTKSLPFTKEQVEAICQAYPTPFYLYDEAGIRRTAEALKAAFSWNPGFKEYFAVKALPNPAILRLLHGLGCGTDCASQTELMLSERSGITGEEIMFSSNETPGYEYEAARRLNAIINLDDISHIPFLEAHGGLPELICCRYNPGSFGLTNAIMGNLYDSKFGMTREQIFEAFRILRDKGVRRFGLHALLISCALDTAYYPRLAEELFTLGAELHDQLGITLDFVNLSGGIGIPYRPEEKQVNIISVGRSVQEVYERIFTPRHMNVRIFTELGRFMTGPHGYLIARVLHEKWIYKHYIGLDATACNLMRPAIYGAYHHITVLGKEHAPLTQVCDVVGSLCENNDKFAVDRPLPEIIPGDIVAIHDAGAHGYSMGYNYNGKLRCAELMLHENGTATLIRRAETPDDYFATLDIYPEFARKK